MQKLLVLLILGYFLSYNTTHAQTPAAEGTYQIVWESEKFVGKVECPLIMRIEIESLRDDTQDILWTSGDWKIWILSEEKVNMGMKVPAYSCIEPTQTTVELIDEK